MRVSEEDQEGREVFKYRLNFHLSMTRLTAREMTAKEQFVPYSPQERGSITTGEGHTGVVRRWGVGDFIVASWEGPGKQA
jgi:ribosomal protein L3